MIQRPPPQLFKAETVDIHAPLNTTETGPAGPGPTETRR